MLCTSKFVYTTSSICTLLVRFHEISSTNFKTFLKEAQHDCGPVLYCTQYFTRINSGAIYTGQCPDLDSKLELACAFLTGSWNLPGMEGRLCGINPEWDADGLELGRIQFQRSPQNGSYSMLLKATIFNVIWHTV